MPHSPLAGQVAALTRAVGPDHQRTVEARRRLAEQQIRHHIERVTRKSPTLNPDQRERLSRLILTVQGGAS